MTAGTRSGPSLIEVAATNAVTTLTLARPESQNTLTAPLLDALHGALDTAQTDPRCRAVVLRGRGGVFCAGMDFAESADDDSASSVRAAERFFDLMVRFTVTGLTVVAVVDGRAIGGGVGLAAASDFVVTTPGAQFALPEALWGLLPCCVLPFLVRRVGFQRAYAMTLSTIAVPGRRAADIGLADEVGDDPETPLRRLLSRVTKLRPATVAAAKRYAADFAPLAPATRRRATEQLGVLTAAPEFRASLDRYLREHRYPWEDDPAT